ncbi:MAG: hypothetical protein ACRD2T_08330 [Thermoanaerobaculia bacterium]
MAQPFVLNVECHAGYRGEETPRRFWLGEREIAVAEELDRWLSPDHRYFKVRGDDGEIYILRHDPEADRWELTLYASGSRRETRLSST